MSNTNTTLPSSIGGSLSGDRRSRQPGPLTSTCYLQSNAPYVSRNQNKEHAASCSAVERQHRPRVFNFDGVEGLLIETVFSAKVLRRRLARDSIRGLFHHEAMQLRGLLLSSKTYVLHCSVQVLRSSQPGIICNIDVSCLVELVETPSSISIISVRHCCHA